MYNPSERVESDSSIEEMIHSVQSGSEADLGALVETYRDYLLSVARYRLPKDLAVKVAPSDVVQETMLQAAPGAGAIDRGVEGESLTIIPGASSVATVLKIKSFGSRISRIVHFGS